jgi:hypothetical protein
MSDSRSGPGQCLIRGDTVHIDHWYPEANGNPKFIEVNLMHVRASDGIRISYDFMRDGWAIEQPVSLSGGTWQEVAFAQSWSLEKPESEETE